MKTWQIPPVNKPQRREPLYWIAIQNGVEVGRNNSIALLRHIWKGQKVTFKAIR
jgi:hypothetical protein